MQFEYVKKSLKILSLVVLMALPDIARAQQKFPALIIVAQDGSGDFKTIQEAVNSVRDLGQLQVKITIKKGIYHEKLVIPSWKKHISLIGENAATTIITNADYSGKAYVSGPDAFGKDKFGTFNSYTVLVQGSDFTAENLTIANTAGRVGQAVALHVEADRVVIKNCRLLGNQDTLYTANPDSRQYYVNCYIEGTTDFIFGEATAVFQTCTINSLSNSYITAAATSPAQQYGYVFFDCRLTADAAAKKVFLGRPWRPYAKTVFIRTNMAGHIVPEGWNAWPGDAMFPNKEKTAFYAEYGSTGEGSSHTKRVAWSKQLSTKAVKQYTLKHIFSGKTAWVPNSNSSEF
ncbi:pectinesterase family protein [Pedobacter heparinus]|uniref:Pectinesterase n=1 Tax=Pedobacter heparinus (strain ATCC 13125 / DSM 2366 / CIP 104194 / JCM 7457 / NBRC 12017 / NCIMB 9290 / NRRL B-14731 / HIM 762-3) TaxID=485917 RepID=C6Y3T8_PEDHD|nr:pectinesterase family protein [Pedobacter heparinus]ACU03367.1 Pectinesterase [Pedobacter heparinus DSM 2366]